MGLARYTEEDFLLSVSSSYFFGMVDLYLVLLLELLRRFAIRALEVLLCLYVSKLECDMKWTCHGRGAHEVRDSTPCLVEKKSPNVE